MDRLDLEIQSTSNHGGIYGMKTITMTLITLLVLNTFNSVAFAQGKFFNPTGTYYEFGEKDSYSITGKENAKKTSASNTIGTFLISGDMKDQGNGVYYVQSGNINVSYSVNLNELETANDKWHLTEDKTKTVDSVKLEDNILKGAIIVQSSLDGENWFVDNVYTDAFSGKVDLSASIFKTKDIHQMNGCFYRVIVAYKLKKLEGSSKVLLWDKYNYEYMKTAEVYQFFVIDKLTIDNGAASPSGKPRKEFKAKVNTGKDNGFDISNVKAIDKDDPHFGWDLGVFTVNGYTRETTDSYGTAVFLKSVGDDITLWFTLKQDIKCLDDNENLSIAEDTNGYDKAHGVKQTNFKHGTLIVKYTDAEGHSTDPVIYTDFLRANTMTGADTRIRIYEEGEYEITLDYEICKNGGPLNAISSYYDYKITFKFSIRNGNTMAFPRDVVTGSELKDGALTPNGFAIDLAESKYLTIDVARKEVTQNADGTLATSVRNNSVGKDGATYIKEGIYEITIKNLYSDGKPTTVTLYVGTDKNIVALGKYRLSVEALNEYIKAGTTIDADGTLIDPSKETEPEETDENVQVATTEEITVEETTADVSEKKSQTGENENTDETTDYRTDETTTDRESSTVPIAPITAVGLIAAASVTIGLKKSSKKENK